MKRTRLVAFWALAWAMGAAIAATPVPARAQSSAGEPGPEVFRYQYSAFADTDLHRSAPPADGRQAMTLRDAVLVVPVAGLGSPNLWFTGAFARNVALDFSGFAPGTPGLSPELNDRGLLFGMSRRLDSGHEVLAVLAGGTFTAGGDYNVPASIGGYGLWRFPRADHSQWGVGASATSELGIPGLLPLLEYRAWQPRWTADVRLPLDADVRWWPAEILSIGGQWQVRGGQYHATDGRLPYNLVRFTEGTLGVVLGLGARIGPQLELVYGRTLFRRYRAQEDAHQVLALDFESAPVLTAKVAWRF